VTDELFTALHFATFHGNFEMIKILIEQMDADVHARNVYGANVLHVSAQGDAPLPLWYYVKNVGMSLSDVDSRGSTPLHWACYSKSEFALLFIVSM